MGRAPRRVRAGRCLSGCSARAAARSGAAHVDRTARAPWAASRTPSTAACSAASGGGRAAAAPSALSTRSSAPLSSSSSDTCTFRSDACFSAAVAAAAAEKEKDHRHRRRCSCPQRPSPLTTTPCGRATLSCATTSRSSTSYTCAAGRQCRTAPPNPNRRRPRYSPVFTTVSPRAPHAVTACSRVFALLNAANAGAVQSTHSVSVERLVRTAHAPIVVFPEVRARAHRTAPIAQGTTSNGRALLVFLADLSRLAPGQRVHLLGLKYAASDGGFTPTYPVHTPAALALCVLRHCYQVPERARARANLCSGTTRSGPGGSLRGRWAGTPPAAICPTQWPRCCTRARRPSRCGKRSASCRPTCAYKAVLVNPHS